MSITSEFALLGLLTLASYYEKLARKIVAKYLGCIVDRIMPLCAGGADHPSDMRWQTAADVEANDLHERE